MFTDLPKDGEHCNVRLTSTSWSTQENILVRLQSSLTQSTLEKKNLVQMVYEFINKGVFTIENFGINSLLFNRSDLIFVSRTAVLGSYPDH